MPLRNVILNKDRSIRVRSARKNIGIELFLDHEVKIFWKFWGSSHGFENTEDLGSSQVVGLANTVGISEVDTNE